MEEDDWEKIGADGKGRREEQFGLGAAIGSRSGL